MEHFDSWVEASSPNLNRKTNSESSKALENSIKMAQKDFLGRVEKASAEKKKRDEKNRGNAEEQKELLAAIKAERKRCFKVTGTMKVLQEEVAETELQIVNMKGKSPVFESALSQIEKNEKMVKDCEKAEADFREFCLNNEKEASEMKESICRPINEVLRNEMLKMYQTRMVEVIGPYEEFKLLRESINDVQKESKDAEAQQKNAKETLEANELQFQKAASELEKIQEVAAELRSKIVQFEILETKNDVDPEISGRIQNLEKERESASRMLEEAREKIGKLEEKAENVEKESEKKLKYQDEQIAGMRKEMDELAVSSLEGFIEEYEKEVNRRKALSILELIEQEEEEIEKLEEFRKTIVLDDIDTEEKFDQEISELDAQLLELISGIEKFDETEKQLDLEMAENEQLENRQTDEKVVPLVVPLESERSRESGKHDLTADMEESMNLSNLNESTAVSPQKTMLNAEQTDTSVATAKKLSSFDPFESGNGKLEPLLTSTPIVQGSRRTQRTATAKRSAEMADAETPPATVKRRSRGGLTGNVRRSARARKAGK